MEVVWNIVPAQMEYLQRTVADKTHEQNPWLQAIAQNPENLTPAIQGYLNEASSSEAVRSFSGTVLVSLVENFRGGSVNEPAFGSTRLPLMLQDVEGAKPPVIIKQYESDPKSEVALQRLLGGHLSPRLLFEGSNFFIEEIIDPRNFTSLWEITMKGEHPVASEQYGIFTGKLASFGLRRWDKHIYDEIFFERNLNLQLIADLGRISKTSSSSKVLPHLREASLQDKLLNFDFYYKLSRYNQGVAQEVYDHISSFNNMNQQWAFIVLLNSCTHMVRMMEEARIRSEEVPYPDDIILERKNTMENLWPAFIQGFFEGYKKDKK